MLLFHALRRAEVSALKVEDYAAPRGIVTLCVHGKGGKSRYVPVKPEAIIDGSPISVSGQERKQISGSQLFFSY